MGFRDEWVEFAAPLQFAYTAELVDVLDREDGGDEALEALRERIATNG